MVLNFVLVVIDHAASDENKRIENKPPLSYAPRYVDFGLNCPCDKSHSLVHIFQIVTILVGFT